MPPDQGSDDSQGYENAYSPEELRLLVAKSISDDVKLRDLLQKIGNIGDGPIQFVKNTFESELISAVKAAIKSRMTKNVINGIKFARSGIKLNSEYFSDLTQKLIKNEIQLTDERLGNWEADFARFYNLLESRYVSIDLEEKLKNLIIEWFEAGEMSLDIWKQWVNWFTECTKNDKEICLSSLRLIKWSASSPRDTVKPKFMRALNATISLDDFVEKTGLQQFLKLHLEVPTLEVENIQLVDIDGNISYRTTSTLNVIGNTMFLSLIKDRLEERMKSIKQVDFVVRNVFYIDCDLTASVWKGKNISVAADKVNVLGQRTFDVSGNGFPKINKLKRAKDGIHGTKGKSGENGSNGRDGKAGESSGNITIVTHAMSNPEKLTLTLNGGNGENGESGGAGGDGQDGKGTDQKELDDLCVKYKSLYRDNWQEVFESYLPNGWTKTENEESYFSTYIHYKFNDDFGRTLHYDYGADKGWTYNWYELMIWIEGTHGTDGGIGGLNGKGGEGGNQGECYVINPDNGTEYPVVKNQRNGDNGIDGKVGACGKSGMNGNDIAMIDRSAKGSNKFYYGEDEKHKLSQNYHRENGQNRRINRYKLIVEKDSACYAEFVRQSLPPGGLRQAQKQKKEKRSSEAQMTMKQSIVLNKVMHKAQEHKNRMDSSLGAATVSMKSSTTQAFEVDEEVEEDESTEQKQEVIIVKEVNEDQLESLNNRARKCKLSQEQYVKKLLSKTYNSQFLLTQEIIDFFFIEFTLDVLVNTKMSLLMLKKCFQFRGAMSDPLKKNLIAAYQAKKGGLSIDELESLAKCASTKRTKKKDLTLFRGKVSGYPTQCHTAQFTANTNVEMVDKKFFHNVKFVNPGSDKLWHFNVSADKIKEIINSFFTDYKLNAVNYYVLETISNAYEKLEPKYSNALLPFNRTTVTWGDPESWDRFKASLDVTNSVVVNLIKTIDSDKEWLAETFKPVNEMIEGASYMDKFKNLQVNELKERFGIVPNFHDGTKEFEAVQYIIRFYWQMKTLLVFNRRLLVISLLYDGETTEKPFVVLKSYATLKMEDMIKRAKSNQIDLGSNNSEQYMLAKGFQSMTFRYLVSEIKSLRIELFGNENYGTVELLETTGESFENVVQLYYNGNRFYHIESDDNLRKLLKAREATKWQADFDENYKRIDELPWDYAFSSDRNQFLNFFPSVFASAVLEWIECYVKATNDVTFLKMLHERFELDGNHFEIADFQYIISTAILLQNEFKVSSRFILNYASSVPQAQLVNAFVMIRLESQWKTQLKQATEIRPLLNSILNNRFKILLVIKLQLTKLQFDDEQNSDASKVSENLLRKMLLMIRHTSARNEQLEKMSLNYWIAASEKQELTELSDAFKNLGTIGYYIIVLRQGKKMDEANYLEELLTNPNAEYHIPEKLIAQVCTLITAGEVNFDTNYRNNLEKILKTLTMESGLNKTGQHRLVTDEILQAKMISKVAKTDAYDSVISEKQRNLKVISDLISGMRETQDEMKSFSLQMKKMIDDGSHETVKLLNEIDDCIAQLRKGIRLRDTQKMAVIYSVQSESNLLAQVNTGEGKSYIVTATAIIRAKKSNSFVDIITSSPVLAQRDSHDMSDIYSAMNVSVDHNCHDEMEKRKQAYQANVVYGEISRFQRDYLLHNFYRKNILGERERSKGCVIVDEVDNMLLDNGNNMLYLSHSVPGMDLLEPLFVHIERAVCSPSVRENPDQVFATEYIKATILSDLLGRLPKEDIPKLAISLKTKGNTFSIWSKLITAQVIDSEGYLMIQTDFDFENRKSDISTTLLETTTEDHAMKILVCLKAIINRPREIEIPRYLVPFCRRHLTEYIENAKRALFMKPNEAYVVDTDRTGVDSDLAPKVTIIDQNTGVDLATSQWSEGLQQCVQMKHGCRVNPISMKAVFVSNVNYLKGYSKINGLSGTLGSYEESKTLVDLYNADLIKIPTFKAKRLYEHVPVIADDEDKWLDALFDEIEDQVKAERSVLVICHSISKVMFIKDGLLERYTKLTGVKKKLLNCFEEESMVVYKREYDEFEFGDKNELRSGRVILATNLAGRGTDIKLSDELKKAGGLHVIVSFLPENSRIEDQAYGRAARCGDLGSGQIIAITDQTDASGKLLSVFDLKLFRDNAEVQRLESLISYYNYHTKIEEDCLTAFKDHCLTALTQMNNSKKMGDEIPTESEIIYLALLDEWALWLDSQASVVKQCAQDMSDSQRSDIIASVKSFLDAHPIDGINNALKWISSPQPMLALGICKLHANEIDNASEIFTNITQKFPEFAGDACYYLGVISQKNVRKVSKVPKINAENAGWFKTTLGSIVNNINDLTLSVLNSKKDLLPECLCEIDDDKRIETEDHLIQAIQGFNRRVERKKEQGIIISRLQQAVGGPQLIKSNGFQCQCDDMTNVYESLCTSAYNMMGHPISFASFGGRQNTIEEKFKAQKNFLKCLREGYVTEKAVNHNIMDYQCEVLKKKYLLSKKKLRKVFESMVEAEGGDKIESYNRTYLQERIIQQKFRIPRREEFWGFLDAYSCFSEKIEIYILNTFPTDGEIQELKNLQKCSAPKLSSLRIQLSDYDLSTKVLYAVEDVEKAFENNKDKLEWLVSMEYLIKDATAIINREIFDKIPFMPNYDYFTDTDVADWLEISNKEAKWIVDKLLISGTLREEVTILTIINPEKPELSEELSNMYDVLNSNDLKKVDDLNFDVIQELFKKSEKETDDIMKKLTNNKILIPKHTRFIFQNIDDFDCSALPECLKSLMETFLYHKFSYTFAYNTLQKSLDAAIKHSAAKKPIMLAWKPHDELKKDLIKYGFLHDHKLELRDKDYLDEEMQKSLEEVEKKTKPRLFIKSGNLMSTKKFFKEENVAASMDIQNQAINHIRQVGKIGENNTWIIWLVLKIAFAVFMAWSIPGLIMMAFDIAINMKTYFQAALVVIAAVGTMLYFIQSVKAKYVTQTGRENPQEKHAMLIDFHAKNVEMKSKYKQECKLAEVITSSIVSKLDHVFHNPNTFAAEVNDAKTNLISTLQTSKVGPRRFTKNVQLFLDQPHNWRLFRENVRNILTHIKLPLCKRYYATLENRRTPRGFDIDGALRDTQKLNADLKINFPGTEKRLVGSLLSKIIEDAGVILQEATEQTSDNNGKSSASLIAPGEDPDPGKMPAEFVVPGSEINIDSDSDSDNNVDSDSDSDSDVDSDSDSDSDSDVDSDSDSDSDVDVDSNLDNDSPANFTKAVDAFITALFSKTKDVYEIELTNNISKSLLNAFQRYIKAANDVSEAPKGFADFFNQAVDEKNDIESRKKQVTSHQSMAYIINDLQEVVRLKYANHPTEELLKVMIQYGHAMEPKTMEKLVYALHRVLKQYIAPLDVLSVVLHLKNGNVVFNTKPISDRTKPFIISLDITTEYFYICQDDSRKIFKNKNDADYVGSCLFESIAQNNPQASELVKQGADVFRELLLQQIYAEVVHAPEFYQNKSTALSPSNAKTKYLDISPQQVFTAAKNKFTSMFF